MKRQNKILAKPFRIAKQKPYISKLDLTDLDLIEEEKNESGSSRSYGKINGSQ